MFNVHIYQSAYSLYTLQHAIYNHPSPRQKFDIMQYSQYATQYLHYLHTDTCIPANHNQHTLSRETLEATTEVRVGVAIAVAVPVRNV